jgi:ubiquinone/menaquinone biosynthesis C-methylase UbiE
VPERAIWNPGTREMIREDRPIALEQVMRVLRRGGRFGIGETMNLHQNNPAVTAFDTLEQTHVLFEHHGFEVTHARHPEDGYRWWLEHFAYFDPSEEDARRSFLVADTHSQRA